MTRALFLAAALLLAFDARAAQAPAIESFTLKNGLEVIVIPNHRVPAVTHLLWFRVGAADDPRGKSGIAHFHEHMMFEGTAKYKPGDYADIIAKHGGQQNASTDWDSTSYYISIARERLALAMELEADRLRGIRPGDAGTAKEKQVILEERRMRIENNPQALLNEQVGAALWRNHPYHIPVIGWMHEMEGLTKDDVLNFHKVYYHPNNAMLIVSGDVTAGEVRALAEKYYGNIPAAPIPPRRWTDEPPQNTARRIVMRHANVRQPFWSRSYAAPSIAYGDKAQALPLLVLAQLLGGGKTSRLYQTLVVDEKLASSVDTSYGAFAIGPAEFEIAVVPEHEVSLEALEKAVDGALQTFIGEGATDEELARAKTLLKADSIYARDGLMPMARVMGTLRSVGLDKDYFTRWPELIDAVTAQEVRAAAVSILKPERSVTAQLLPGEK